MLNVGGNCTIHIQNVDLSTVGHFVLDPQYKFEIVVYINQTDDIVILFYCILCCLTLDCQSFLAVPIEDVEVVEIVHLFFTFSKLGAYNSLKTFVYQPLENAL